MSYEIILDGARFEWTQDEIEHFRELWNGGKTIPVYKRIEHIAETMKEDPDNIALLVMDQAREGKIE